MFDQLRFDYLGCAGHPTIKTPNIDRLAAKGVRFTNTYTQSHVSGAARMSAYTGRYVSSDGAQWNGYPLRVGEMTLGDHLRADNVGCVGSIALVWFEHRRRSSYGIQAAFLKRFPTKAISFRTPVSLLAK